MRAHVNDGYVGDFYAAVVASVDPGFCPVCKVQVPDTELHMENRFMGRCDRIVGLGAPQ